MIVTYVARRSLVQGHTADTEYQLTIQTTAIARTRKAEKVVQRAIGGATETLWFRTDNEWTLTFEPLRGAQLAALQEFLDSAERGEAFRLTLPGDVAPGRRCRRIDDAYTLTPLLALGDPLALDWFQISCSVIEL